MRQKVMVPIRLLLLLTLFLITNSSHKSRAGNHLPVAQSPARPILQGNPISSQDWSGLDILFIVDQSGSMGGEEFGLDGRVSNDPQGFRFKAPQYALEWLSIYRQSVLKADDLRLRIALLAFGSDQRLLLNWTPLVEAADGSIPTPTVWRQQLDQLKYDISADRFGFTNLYNTNFRDAVHEGKNLFDRAPSLAAGEKHLRVIIILTDGSACVTNEGCETDAYSTKHLGEVESIVRNNFPEDYYVLYVVAMNNQDDPTLDNHWGVLGPLWRSALCPDLRASCTDLSVTQISTLAEIPVTFNKILTELVSYVQPPVVTRIDLNPQPTDYYNMPPFQQLMRLNYYKVGNEDLSNQISLTRAGAKVNETDPPIGTNDLIEIHIYDDPQPGNYTLTLADPSAVTGVAVDYIASTTTMDQPADSNQFEPVTLFFRVLNQLGGTLQHYDVYYPLDVRAQLYSTHDPLNPQFLSELQLEDDLASGLYQFTGEWLPTGIFGPIEVRISAKYDFDGGVEWLAKEETLASFYIYENYVLNKGVPITSVLEGESFEILADVRQKGTDAPILNIGHMGLRLEIENTADPTMVIPDKLLLNDGTLSGTIHNAFELDNPGTYSVSSTAVVISPIDGSTQDLPNSTRTDVVTVRPINELTLSVRFVPDESKQPAIKNDLKHFFPNTMTELRVELRDKDNSLIPLEIVTGGSEILPKLVIYKGDKELETVELKPVPGQNGVYAFRTDQYRDGTYRARVSVTSTDQSLIGDYRWRQPTDTAQVSRVIPAFFAQTLLLIFLALALILAASIGLVLYYRWLTSAPIRGTIAIFVREEDKKTGGLRTQEVWSSNLDKPNRFRKVFKKKAMDEIFTRMVVSTKHEAQQAERGTVYVDLQTNNGTKRSITLRKGELKSVDNDGYAEYWLGKDYSQSSGGAYRKLF